jgi:hypothetical protein
VDTADDWHVLSALADVIHGDRRQMLRCRAALDLRFHYRDSCGQKLFGRGTTVDLSRLGIRFVADGPAPPAGATLEIRIDWPVRLQERLPVELLINGTLVRHDEEGLVVAVDRYEFRTTRERSFDEWDEPPAMYSLTA